MIRGFAYERRDPQRPSDFPACLVCLSDGTGLDGLRLVGAVAKNVATLSQWLGAIINTAIAHIKPGIMVRTDERVDRKGDQNPPPRSLSPVRNSTAGPEIRRLRDRPGRRGPTPVATRTR